ncbi:21922_t:CDS:2, partial [Dentiscutata erythropus]
VCMMLCYADIIVRIKYVTFYENEKINSLVVWALGAYPIEQEDYNIEMSLGKIIPEFYGDNRRAKMIVSTSTHVAILNKVVESNKCPFKMSLVGIPQELPSEVKDNTVIKTLVSDFSGQEHNFTVKVVFSRYNHYLTCLKDSIHSQESLIFVFSNKKRFFDSDASQNLLASKSNKASDDPSGSDLNSAGCSDSTNRARTNSFNGSFNDGSVDVENEYFIDSDYAVSDCSQDEEENSGKDSKYKKKVFCNKEKEPVERSLHSRSSLYRSSSGNV